MARRWEFPGGKLEEGETPQQALAREIQEELDSVITVGAHVMTVNHQYQTFSITMHAYLCTLISGHLELEEHLAARWLDKTNLYSVDWADADIPIVQAIEDKVM